MEFIGVPVRLAAAHDYYGIFLLMIIILFLIVLCNLCMTAKRYSNLPSNFTGGFQAVYTFLINNTKRLPFLSVLFQKMDLVAKQFEKEGIYHTWCFRNVVFIFGEESVKVFATNEASADKPPEYEIIKEPFGEGLVTSNGETWKNDRKLMNSVFHLSNLKTQLPVFNENAKILLKKLENAASKPDADLFRFLKHCVFHNICESIFDVNMKDKVSEMEIEHFFRQMTWLQKYLTLRWFFPPIIAKIHRFCSRSGWKSRKIYREFKQYGLKVISSVRESISHKSFDSTQDLDLNRKSIIHILLQHQLNNSSIPSSHLEDHVHTSLAAGIDTVYCTMMWCLYMLGLHKDVQQKAYDEIQMVADEFITYENLCQLEYLECIIKETLRLYPTIPVFGRYLKKDLKCGKYTVPNNTTIVFFLYRLHRNPEIYPDPEKFDPDRFRSTSTQKRKWAHLPFSEGYRNCIGKKLAMMEMKVTLAYILRNYEITSFDRREDVDVKWNFVLIPNKPLRMSVTRR